MPILHSRNVHEPPYALEMGFGERLAAARIAAGLTQAGLGRGLGTDGSDCHKSVVLGWEKGRHFPRVDQLVLICRKLNCSADELLFGQSSEWPFRRTPIERVKSLDPQNLSFVEGRLQEAIASLWRTPQSDISRVNQGKTREQSAPIQSESDDSPAEITDIWSLVYQDRVGFDGGADNEQEQKQRDPAGESSASAQRRSVAQASPGKPNSRGRIRG